MLRVGLVGLIRLYFCSSKKLATPLEFAEIVGQAIEEIPLMTRWADLPRSLVRLFYRARYGGQPLSPAEHDALENRMNDVARATEEA